MEKRKILRGGRERDRGLRLGLALKGLEQINITWTEMPTGRVSGSLSLVLTATAGASITHTYILPLSLTPACAKV